MDLPSTSSNGGGEEAVGSEGLAKKDELLRVLTEVLYSLGYDGAGLEQELGIQLHIERLNLLMDQMIDGKWDESLETLRDIRKSVDKISLLILEYKFSKLLSGGKVKEASNTLRHEIVPLVNGDEVVRKNSSLIVSPSQNLLYGAPGRESRLRSFKKMKEDLRNFPSPMVIIPKKRLFSHVEQSLDFLSPMVMFSLTREASLIISHCRVRDEASKHIQKSMVFEDEVWFVQFSRDGKYLAAATGTDVCICEIVEYGGLLFMLTLEGHEQPVSYITWCPKNNIQLLTCGVEETVKRWIIAPAGRCLHTYAKLGLGMVSCVWAPDGQSIFTGLNDGSIIMWNLQGDELRSWETKTTRIADLLITRDGSELITTCEENTILLFKWESGSERYIDEDGAIVSLSLSEDSNLLLVSMSYAAINLWNIGLETPQMVKSYDGHKRQRFVVRACICEANQPFVASGSEDSKVYISEWETGEHGGTLAGHSAVVNCVSSNPTDPRMLASGSDDHTIRLWRY